MRQMNKNIKQIIDRQAIERGQLNRKMGKKTGLHLVWFIYQSTTRIYRNLAVYFRIQSVNRNPMTRRKRRFLRVPCVVNIDQF